MAKIIFSEECKKLKSLNFTCYGNIPLELSIHNSLKTLSIKG